MVAGFTIYDRAPHDLALLLAEWTSSRVYDERVDNLRSGSGPILSLSGVKLSASGPTRTVFDDQAKDNLKGSRGREWFLADVDRSNRNRDKAKNKKDELVDKIFATWDGE